MARLDGTSWQYDRPEGVTCVLHVPRNLVEPSVGNSVRHLLSSRDWRLKEADDPGCIGP
jgi:hypothetical protein